MKWICIMAGAVTLTSSARIAKPTISHCPAPLGVVEVVLPSGLPAILRDLMDDVTLPGEPFDSTDVYVKGHKHRRYIFVWNIGSRWIVATEQGGITLRSGIFVYDLGKDRKTATLIDKHLGFVNNVCTTASKLAVP